MALSLKQKIPLVIRAEKCSFTLATVQHLLKSVYPELHKMEKYELCKQLKEIEDRLETKHKLYINKIVKESNLSLEQKKKLLDLS